MKGDERVRQKVHLSLPSSSSLRLSSGKLNISMRAATQAEHDGKGEVAHLNHVVRCMRFG
jgi:hypothetical protein